MQKPAGKMTPGYIYPHLGTDLLNLYLFPDEMDMEITNGGASELHPSLGHSVTQLTGRGSPSFSFSVMFDGVEPSYPIYSGQDPDGSRSVAITTSWKYGAGHMVKDQRRLKNPDPDPEATVYYPDQTYRKIEFEQINLTAPVSGNPAHQAYLWILRNIGPNGEGDDSDKAKVFVMKLWGDQAHLVRFSSVKIKPLIVSSSQGQEGVVRRFKASFSGDFYFPIVVDAQAFKVRRKKPPVTKTYGTDVPRLREIYPGLDPERAGGNAYGVNVPFMTWLDSNISYQEWKEPSSSTQQPTGFSASQLARIKQRFVGKQVAEAARTGNIEPVDSQRRNDLSWRGRARDRERKRSQSGR